MKSKGKLLLLMFVITLRLGRGVGGRVLKILVAVEIFQTVREGFDTVLVRRCFRVHV